MLQDKTHCPRKNPSSKIKSKIRQKNKCVTKKDGNIYLPKRRHLLFFWCTLVFLVVNPIKFIKSSMFFFSWPTCFFLALCEIRNICRWSLEVSNWTNTVWDYKLTLDQSCKILKTMLANIRSTFLHCVVISSSISHPRIKCQKV